MWKKRIVCLALLALCAVVLTACQPKEHEIFSEVPPAPTQVPELSSITPEPKTQADPTATVPQAEEVPDPQGQPDASTGGIDYDDPANNPAAEEDGQDVEFIVDMTPAPMPATPEPFLSGEYPGATPMMIDPIDKPTPTPVPKITFDTKSGFDTYTAGELHLSFKGPKGWVLSGPGGWGPGSDAPDTYTLTNPDTALDYTAQIRIRVVSVNEQYNKSDLDKEVKALRDAARNEMEFTEFNRYDTASRAFIKIRDPKSSDENPKYVFIEDKGQETQFRGVLAENGAKVAGRMIIGCYNKKLYILYCTYPSGELREAFETIFTTARESLTLIP